MSKSKNSKIQKCQKMENCKIAKNFEMSKVLKCQKFENVEYPEVFGVGPVSI